MLIVLEIVETTFSDIETLLDSTGERTACGDRLSSKLGRFLITLAGLVAILNL